MGRVDWTHKAKGFYRYDADGCTWVVSKDRRYGWMLVKYWDGLVLYRVFKNNLASATESIASEIDH